MQAGSERSGPGEVRASSAGTRFDTIDLLRGISILGVVLLHASLWLSFANYEVGRSFPKWLRYVVFNSGGNGVSTFFAVSGFLITYVSIKRFGALRHISATRFYRMRFARIAPLLTLLLLVLSILHLAGADAFRIPLKVGTLPEALFAAITFQLNWFEAVHGWLPPCWTVLWSLSVEEMFYLFFPITCMVFLRKRWSRPLFIVVLCGLTLFGPFARIPWYSKNEIWLYQSYLGNMDNVAMGCLFAMLTVWLSRSGRFLRSSWPAFLQAVGAILMLIIFCEWPRVILGWHFWHVLGRSGTDVSVLGLGTCLVMVGCVLREREGSRWTAPLRWLGRSSYEIYLTHEFVVMGVLSLFLRVRTGPVGLWIGATVVLSGVLGYVLSRFFSEPLNRVLRTYGMAKAMPFRTTN